MCLVNQHGVHLKRKTMVKIDLIPVYSQLISKLGYDEPTQTLAVEFIKGGLYYYTPVTINEAEILMNEEHKGKWFLKHIKGNKEIICTKVIIEDDLH